MVCCYSFLMHIHNVSITCHKYDVGKNDTFQCKQPYAFDAFEINGTMIYGWKMFYVLWAYLISFFAL